jgi:hypothetical protein
MAIIVVTFPSPTASALECLEWTFTMDDIGSPRRHQNLWVINYWIPLVIR